MIDLRQIGAAIEAIKSAALLDIQAGAKGQPAFRAIEAEDACAKLVEQFCAERVQELRTIADHAALLTSENGSLRARVESQRQVIEDLRRELELACRRIVELERGEGDGA